MRTVWKYAVDVGEVGLRVELAEPLVVHVGPDPDPLVRNYELPRVWIEHDPALIDVTGPRELTLRFVGTGHPIPDGWRHVGSAVISPFVWHVYQQVR